MIRPPGASSSGGSAARRRRRSPRISRVRPPLGRGRMAGGQRDDLLLARAGRQLAGDAAGMHDQQPVAQADRSRASRRAHQHRLPCSEIAQDAVDRGLGGDVDAARRLAQRAGRRQASQRASWSSADCRPTSRPCAGRSSPRGHRPRAAPLRCARRAHCAGTAAAQTPARSRAPPAARFRAGLMQRQALALAVVGNIADARPPPPGAGSRTARHPRRSAPSPRELLIAEDGARQCRFARSLEARDADDLAGAQNEIDVADEFVAGPAHRQRRAGRRDRPRREVVLELAADHHAHDLVGRDLAAIDRRHLDAILEDGDPIGDGEDLRHAMGDEDRCATPSAASWRTRARAARFRLRRAPRSARP